MWRAQAPETDIDATAQDAANASASARMVSSLLVVGSIRPQRWSNKRRYSAATRRRDVQRRVGDRRAFRRQAHARDRAVVRQAGDVRDLVAAALLDRNRRA